MSDTPAIPVDPDVDLHVPAQRAELAAHPWAVLLAISAGGIVGALARYGLGVAFPAGDGFPWATFAVNVSGCLLIGGLMVLVTEVWTRWPLARPLLGVGVLGGYTTFSTYAVEIQRLAAAGRVGLAAGYLAATVGAALTAVYIGGSLTRWAVRRRTGAAGATA